MNNENLEGVNFIDIGIKELWIKYGIADKARYTHIHRLATVLGLQICKTLRKAHAVSGCDVTSKVGTKATSLKNHQKTTYNILVNQTKLKQKTLI